METAEYSTIAHTIPEDHARSATAEDMLAEALEAPPAGLRVLDLGCGTGDLVDVLRGQLPELDYTGVDIEVSPEVGSRSRTDARFVTFDGVNLPFGDGVFDLVFSRQVFEHVRHPDALMAEVSRVLAPGGHFLGSMSGLEPYHSYSIFNVTPWGLYRLVEENGLRLARMRPGTEAVAMITRQMSGRRLSLGLVYPAVRLAAALRGWSIKRRNYLKLRFAAHLCFIARKPEIGGMSD